MTDAFASLQVPSIIYKSLELNIRGEDVCTSWFDQIWLRIVLKKLFLQTNYLLTESIAVSNYNFNDENTPPTTYYNNKTIKRLILYYLQPWI